MEEVSRWQKQTIAGPRLRPDVIQMHPPPYTLPASEIEAGFQAQAVRHLLLVQR